MRRAIRSVMTAILLASGISSSTLPAQAADPLAQALSAYRDLEFDAAATRLRTALAATGSTRLGDADRQRALMHLGATESFRSRREAAAEAFRNLLLLNPRYRPDEIVFPPEVSALFHEVRIGVRAIAVVAAPESVIQDPGDRLSLRLYASSLHQVQVTVRTPDGTLAGVLHDGAVGDSLDLLWDARQERGQPRAAGRYLLRVSSRAPDGRSEREVDLPLDLSWDAVDTLPLPAPPELRPESAEPTGRARPLAVALIAGLVAIALPDVVGASGDASGMRFAVAGTLGVAGIAGLATASRRQPLPDNISWNRVERARWDAEVARVRAENDQRRTRSPLRIRAGRQTAVDVR
jgi:hypothetical protein